VGQLSCVARAYSLDIHRAAFIRPSNGDSHTRKAADEDVYISKICLADDPLLRGDSADKRTRGEIEQCVATVFYVRSCGAATMTLIFRTTTPTTII